MELQGLAVNDKVVWKAKNTTVIVDTGMSSNPSNDLASSLTYPTGTQVVVGFSKDVEMLYSNIPGAKELADFPGSFTVPCECIPTVGIQLGGKIFNIAPENFNLGVFDGNDCLGGVFGEDTARALPSFLLLFPVLLMLVLAFWVLGADVFIKVESLHSSAYCPTCLCSLL